MVPPVVAVGGLARLPGRGAARVAGGASVIPHAIHAFRADTEKGGLVFHGDIIGDGKLHRTGTANKPKGLDGAYVLHLDTPASGWWKNFCTGESGTWTAGDS